MPSIFTIEGAETPAARRKRKRELGDANTPDNAECRTVKNPRTGCEMQLCRVPKSESRTGWKFKKGSSSCPTRRR